MLKTRALLLLLTALVAAAGASAAICNVECDARSSKEPVCGSDGKTYENQCLLEFAKCDHPELAVAGRGACGASSSKMHVRAKVSSNAKETAACNQFCDRVLDPVCGSDNVTYNNKCLFEYAKCLNPSLTLKSEDACK